MATQAVCAARLGSSVALVTDLGDDLLGSYLQERLSAEGVELAATSIHPDWPTPVTVSLNHDGDRAMVTRQPEPPAFSPSDRDPFRPGRDDAEPPLGFAHLGAVISSLGSEPWWQSLADRGAKVFLQTHCCVDGEFHPEQLQQLAGAFAFTPNLAEALSLTRTKDPSSALRQLGELVPLVVITLGDQGALGLNSATGETVQVPGIPVACVDATGAGDVFTASLVHAQLTGLNLTDSLRLAVLTAGLAVSRSGSASAAPHWPDLLTWRSDALAKHLTVASDYNFLEKR
jgi:sugar/nucleoside kinase (ribokinase family)